MKKRTGVLLVNLGTPDSPHPNDVHRYLIEFLCDGRVIDMPWLKRQLLVRGAIVPRRYKLSAKAYQEIWTAAGSPLLVHSRNLQQALQVELGEFFPIELGMRYQNPSLESALEKLFKADISRLVILPLFPQYASATTGSVQQKVMELLSPRQVIPEVTFIDHYFTHPGLIAAFCAAAKEHAIENYHRILFSFHGLPTRQLIAASCHNHCLSAANCCEKLTATNRQCYAAQCYATAKAIAGALGLPPERYTVCFQSRLGKDPWLKPYTSEVIADCAAQKQDKILVFCPSFVCDCLETIYEIGIEYTADFKKVGGNLLTLVPGLNNHPVWVKGLKDIILGS